MFSKYKKSGGAAAPAVGATSAKAKPAMSAVTAMVAEDAPRKSLMKAMPGRPAEVATGDRDKSARNVWARLSWNSTRPCWTT